MSAAALAAAPLPQWTEASYGRTGGQYHLGLAGVLFGQVLPSLSPRVVAATAHPRYWSFYTWLLWEFWESDRSKTRDEWSRFELARESLFSIGVAGGLCGRPEHATMEGGVVGSNTTKSIGASGGPYEVPVEFLANDQGGYGQQYAGSLAETGLTILASTKPGLHIDAPLARGASIGKAFRQAVKSTTYYQDQFHQDQTEVTHASLVEFMERACLCQLRTDAGTERDLLRAAFLEGDGGKRQLATFQLYVDLAAQTDGVALDEQMFRELVYFRGLTADAGRMAFTPVSATTDAARHWRLYQLRYYFSFALNRLWQWTVDWASGRSEPTVAISSIVARADAALVASVPSGAAPLYRWRNRALDGTDAEASADGPWRRSADDEQALMDRATELATDDSAVVAVCLQLLTVLMTRLEDWPEGSVDHELLDAGDPERLGLRAFHNQWSAWLADGSTARDVVACLLETEVIDRHIRVAYSKLPTIDTLRFSREGARLRLHDQVADISLGGARFGALSTVVHELGYTGAFSRPGHAPTDAGLALLEQDASS